MPHESQLPGRQFPANAARGRLCSTGLPLFIVPVVALAWAGAVSARPYASFSGLGAAADSALTAGTNPAGITRLEGVAWQVEALAFYSESTWLTEIDGGDGERRTEDSGDLVVPTGYLVYPINEDFTFGFTMLGAGFSDDFGDWPLRYVISSYDSLNISAFPSIAYRVNDKLSIAGSLSLSYASFEQERAIANVFDPGYPDGRGTLETDGLDAGFGLSMLYEVNDQLRWGLSYLSEVDPTLEGKVRYRGLGPNTQAVLEEAGFAGADVEVKSRTPQSLLAGLYHEFDNRHAITVDLAWSQFSRFKLSEFYFDGEGLAEIDTDYQDLWALSTSYSWPVSSRWMLSVAGLYVDDMVEDDDRSVTLRLDHMWSLGVAAQWQWTEQRAVQVGLSYMTLGDAPVTTPDIPGIGSISGKFTDRDTLFLRIGLSWGAL